MQSSDLMRPRKILRGEGEGGGGYAGQERIFRYPTQTDANLSLEIPGLLTDGHSAI